MRILLTGCAGFIGFQTARALLESDHSVIGIDSVNDYYDPRLKFSRLQQLGVSLGPKAHLRVVGSTTHPKFSFWRVELENMGALKEVFAANTFDVVINLAGRAGVRYSIDHPDEYISSNVMGFVNLLECCRSQETRHFLFASSSSVYGLNQKLPFSVGDNTDHPLNIYAATKKADELIAHSYSHLFGIPVTGLRFFTVYGPWGRPDMAYYRFAEAIREDREIDMYGNGELLRDFTYVDDVVDAIVRAMDAIPTANPTFDVEHPLPGRSCAPYRILNVGNNRPESVRALVEQIEKAMGRKARCRSLPIQPGDVFATRADISETESLLSWRPVTDLEKGVPLFVDWLNAYKPVADD